jgi:hypothetical protein
MRRKEVAGLRSSAIGDAMWRVRLLALMSSRPGGSEALREGPAHLEPHALAEMRVFKDGQFEGWICLAHAETPSPGWR